MRLIFVFMFLSFNLFAQTPKLSNFRVENSNKNRVYFDSSEPITASTTTGFYLSDNLRKKITGVTINAGQTTGHYFRVGSNFDYWDTYAIRYEGGSDMQDIDANPLHEFWLHEVVNNIPEPAPSGTVYWVRTTGNDTNDGLSHATAFKTINKAMSLNARTIYIEAGDYGAENLRFTYSGTSANPIIMQGYKTQTNGVPDEIIDNYWSWGAYGTGTNVTVDTSEMPTLTGTPTLRETYSSSGWAIDPSDYIIIKNIQTINWNMGVRITSSDHMTLKNITCIYNGNTKKGLGGGVWVVGGQGQGVDMYNKFINIEIAQSAAVGFRQYGGGSLFDNVNVNNDIAEGNPYSSPDYYISIYQGSNNVIKNCTVKEIGETPGSSHGIGFKGSGNGGPFPTEYNLVTDCEVRNMIGGLELRHDDVKNNVCRNVEIYALPEDGTVDGYGNNNFGIVNRDGASFNKFENITLDRQHAAFYFTDTSEQGDQQSASDCTFRNILVTNSNRVFGTRGSSGQPNIANMVFDNLTVDNCTRLFYIISGYALKSDSVFRNCSFSNITKLSNTSGYSPTYENCNFVDNGFSAQSGTNITTHPTLFTNSANGDYTLQDTSLLIDIGQTIDNYYDFNGYERTAPYSIGAYEVATPTVGSVSPDVDICSGENTTLTAAGGSSYTWSNGATTPSITVSPNTTQTYTVTVSDGSNSDSYDLIVTVNEAPTVDAGSDLTICYGESATLTATGIGNFLWSTGETTSSITVSPSTTTTYSVTASNSCSTDATDQVIVTVNEQVIANAGSDITINEGDNTTLTASGGDTYIWNTGATTQSITVSPNATTNYTVTATKNGCDDSDSVQVTVSPTTGTVTANAGADQTICQGESVTLTASGGSTYSWNTGATTKSITVNPNTTSTYTVTVSDGSASDSDAVTVAVSSVTANAGSDVSINEGDSITLTASGGDSYVWNTGATTESITVSPTSTTTYTVTAKKGTCEDTDTVQVTVNSASTVTANAGSDQAICLGDNVTLTASGGSIYSWNTGATTKSITVNPNTTTTYTVTVSDGSASDSDSVIVAVSSVTANAGGNQSITVGDSVTLTASGGDSYVWNTGATTKSITVSPTSTTTYTVTAKKGDCEDTDTVQVTVNAAATVTANAGSDQAICLGESVTLTASGGSIYSWNTGATTKSITVNPNSTITYTVTVTEGSASDSDSVQVTVNSVTANAGSDKTITQGENVTLTASGGSTYLWSTGATSKSITVSPQESQNYTLTAYKNGCEDIDTVQVTVTQNDTSPPPAKADAGEDQTICLGESIKLTASGGATYLWSTGETSKTINVNPTRTTTYTVTATRGGVTNSDAVDVTVENCSAVSEAVKQEELLVYPNPSTGTISIKADNDFNSLHLNIYSMNGSIVYSDEVQTNDNVAYKSVDLSNLSKGVYIVRMYNADYHKTKRVLLF